MADPIPGNRHAPSGWHTLTPRLVTPDPQGLVDFLRYVLDATVQDQSDGPTIMEIGDSKVMVSSAGLRSPKAAFLYVYVADVESTYRRALERGAESIEEPFDTPYGDRRCMVEDKWGNVWQMAVARRSGSHPDEV